MNEQELQAQIEDLAAALETYRTEQPEAFEAAAGKLAEHIEAIVGILEGAQ